MLTISEIQKKIKFIEADIENNYAKMTSGKIKKEKQLIEFYRQIERYLETGPRESFMDSEKQRLTNLINSIESRYKNWCRDIAPKNIDPKKYKALFSKETGLSKAKKELKTINFILS